MVSNIAWDYCSASLWTESSNIVPLKFDTKRNVENTSAPCDTENKYVFGTDKRAIAITEPLSFTYNGVSQTVTEFTLQSLSLFVRKPTAAPISNTESSESNASTLQSESPTGQRLSPLDK